MTRVASVVAALLALTIVVAGCGGGGGSSSATPGQVTVKDNFFTPSSSTVKVGDTVTWTFKGQSAHNVTFDGFNSNLMKTGTYTHTFATAGTFEYHCTIHSGMTAKIVVTNSSAP